MRKWQIVLAVLAGCLLAYLGLSYGRRGVLPGSREQVVIRFWNGFTGPDGRTMLRLIRRFNEENPDVHVMMQRIAWGTYYNKLFVAGLGGRAPEVFVIHTDWLTRFMLTGSLRPIDDLMAGPNGIDVIDIDANIWDAVELDGAHIALPLDIHPLGLYYNRALFREAGIVDEFGEAKPPTNREEFLDAARRLTKDTTGDGRTDQWGFVFTWFRTNYYAVMKQFGGEVFNDEVTRCILDDPRNIEALQFCADLIRKEKVAPPPEGFDAWIGFRQGKVGMAFEGIYMLADVEKQQDLDYAGAPIPQLGYEPASWAGSHNLCMRKDMDPEKVEAAWRFMKFLSDSSLDWADGGQVPVRKSLRESDRFRQMEMQRQFAKQIPYAHYLPGVNFSYEFGQQFDLAVESVLRGSASPEDALAGAAQRLNEIIARQERDLRESEEARR